MNTTGLVSAAPSLPKSSVRNLRHARTVVRLRHVHGVVTITGTVSSIAISSTARRRVFVRITVHHRVGEVLGHMVQIVVVNVGRET